MGQIEKVTHLPTSTNLSNLTDEQVIEYTNSKFQNVFDVAIQLAYAVKECGDGLKELQARYDGSKSGQKKEGFNQLFVCPNFGHTKKMLMSRQQAYSYIQISQNWMLIEPKLHKLKDSAIRNGKVSPAALMRLVDDEMQQAEVPDTTVVTVEVEKVVTVEVVKEVAKPNMVSIEIASAAAKKQTEAENQLKEIQKLRQQEQQELANLRSQISSLTNHVPKTSNQNENSEDLEYLEELEEQNNKLERQIVDLQKQLLIIQNPNPSKQLSDIVQAAGRVKASEDDKKRKMGVDKYHVCESYRYFKGNVIAFLEYLSTNEELQNFSVKKGSKELLDIIKKEIQ